MFYRNNILISDRKMKKHGSLVRFSASRMLLNPAVLHGGIMVIIIHEFYFNLKDIIKNFVKQAYGKSIGSLRVYISDHADINRTLLWELSEEQSENQMDWKQGVIPLIDIDYDYKIIIEGTIGKEGFITDLGDIA